MRRAICTLITAAASIFLVTTMSLWILSYSRDTRLSITLRSFEATLRTIRGHTAVGLFVPVEGFSSKEFGGSLTSYAAQGMSDLEFDISDGPAGYKRNAGGLGFYLVQETVSNDVQYWLVVPSWFVAII